MKLILFLVALAMTSCIKTADNIKLPADQGNKLVVGCFISPQDSILTATVTKSHSPYGYNETGSPNVTNAAVLISDGINTKNFIYNTTNKNYELSPNDFSISASKTYSLKVNVPGFSEVSASTTVPSVRNTTLEIIKDSVKQQYSDGYNPLLTFRWRDDGAEMNYYHLGIEDQYINKFMSGIDTLYYFSSLKIVSDQDAIQGKFLLTQEIYNSYTSTDQKSKVLFLTTDVNYFNYYRWLNNPGGEDPFSEPKITFTNIQGGLGVFAAYQKFSTPLK